MPDTATLDRLRDRGRTANTIRSMNAASRTVAAAQLALWQAGPGIDVPVLQVRVDHPYATLAELGDKLQITKYAYAARLRRALRRGVTR